MTSILAETRGISISAEDSEGRWKLAQGQAYHSAFQDELLLSLGRVFQGWWKCKVCAAIHVGARGEGAVSRSFFGREPVCHDSDQPRTALMSYHWIPRPDECVCGFHDRETGVSADVDPKSYRAITGHCQFSYVEPRWSPTREFPIGGHVDGVLDWREYAGDSDEVRDEIAKASGAGVDLVEHLELKTINELGFNGRGSYIGVDPETFGRPKDGHILQSAPYRFALGVRATRFVYLRKAADNFDDMFAEHVHVDDALIGTILDTVREVNDIWESWVPGSPLPPVLPECDKKTAFRPKYLCACADICFRRR